MGTSYLTCIIYDGLEDHPHAYGDKMKSLNPKCHFLGSSPRVWGQVATTTTNGAAERIIPTRMGTRCAYLSWRKYSRDHPHAYGDKVTTPFTAPINKGSSPRVWGQDSRRLLYIFSTGIIPTRMGTSTIRKFCAVVKQDHPHAYGDKECVYHV